MTCPTCGGTHYGSGSLCPFQCDGCGYKTEPCDTKPCPRDERWERQQVLADAYQAITATRGFSPNTMVASGRVLNHCLDGPPRYDDDKMYMVTKDAITEVV